MQIYTIFFIFVGILNKTPKMPQNSFDIITVTGATATGKTKIAARLAYELETEIISADSRQVYKNMNIGTGKDIEEYSVLGKNIKFHLIDIVEAGEKYNVFRYQKDFLKAFDSIRKKNKIPVLCGGTGMYIESVLNGYELINVPVNEVLRAELEKKTDSELTDILQNNRSLHNISDTSSRKRLIRAVEIALFYSENKTAVFDFPKLNPLIIQVETEKEYRWQRIKNRLEERLKNGMIEEVKYLLESGVPEDTLVYYGLEYKFVTMYLSGKLTFEQMQEQLYFAIRQFSKRQLTWFRKMEADGFNIFKLNGELPVEENVKKILEML